MLMELETRYCIDIAERVSCMRAFLNDYALAEPPDATQWYPFLSELRRIQGNLSSDVSFVATHLAKQFLSSRFEVEFDAADKPQGAPGIDIDIRTADGKRIVGKIKTMVPYQATDFGAQQAADFKKDFAKLAVAEVRGVRRTMQWTSVGNLSDGRR